MCGVVGIGGPFGHEEIGAALKRMNVTIAHRGPDDEGVWASEGFGFAMRRLSIIDIAGGQQPMWDEKTGMGIVYNGEIYNYRTLRKKMEKRGVLFSTRSDTEVVLKSLVTKGAEAVHDWNGMFAVACWNKDTKKLILLRDRLGVKPLYYFWDGTNLIFASEIKALLTSGLFQPKLHKQAIWDYLTFRYVTGPESVWHQIWKLPPGHMLEWSPGTIPRLQRYWNTDVIAENDGVPIDHRIKEFEDLFLDSVQQRLLASDVPVGILLSGGLDSSSVAAAAAELGHKDFHTFTVGFHGSEEYSELEYARLIAKHLKTQHHDVTIDRRTFIEMLPETVRSADEPLADLSAVALLRISRLARENVKVVLSGEGGDELFAGYDLDRYVRFLEIMNWLQMLPRGVVRRILDAGSFWAPRYAPIFKQIGQSSAADWKTVLRVHITKHWNEKEKKSLWPSFEGMDSGRILDDLYATAASKNPLDQILSVYQRSWLVEDLLMKADKMSMAASLEVRVPFLDYRLVEWANRLPVELKVGRVGLSRYVTKYIVRCFAQARLPKSIIRRPKLGFPVPAYEWLRDGDMSAWALTHLTGNGSRLGQVFCSARIKDELVKARSGDLRAAHKTWLLIILEMWCREYQVDVASH